VEQQCNQSEFLEMKNKIAMMSRQNAETRVGLVNMSRRKLLRMPHGAEVQRHLHGGDRLKGGHLDDDPGCAGVSGGSSTLDPDAPDSSTLDDQTPRNGDGDSDDLTKYIGSFYQDKERVLPDHVGVPRHVEPRVLLHADVVVGLDCDDVSSPCGRPCRRRCP
jgi:hypothetical protein